jgi:hypothetical protein
MIQVRFPQPKSSDCMSFKALAQLLPFWMTSTGMWLNLS